MSSAGTLGAAFLGNLAAGIFYGITCVQAFIYYRQNQKDTQLFKLLIFFLWILDSLHLALVTHGLYFYMVSKYGDPSALLSPTWSLLSQIYVTCISDVIIRGVFGRRVWLVTGKNNILAAGIALTSGLTCVTGFVFASRAFEERTFAGFSNISVHLYISLASGVAADVLIAASLCTYLARNRTGFKNTDSLVNVLMIYAINTSLLTTICSAACLITYTIWPHEFAFIGIYFILSKLFLNSLLATLNGRRTLLEKTQGRVNSIPIGLPALSSKAPTEFSAKDNHSVTPSRQPVVVTINRQVVTADESPV